MFQPERTMTPYRIRYCPRCGSETLHERPADEEGGVYRGGNDALTFALAVLIWCLWPVVLFLCLLAWPLIWLASLLGDLRPYWCSECGRMNCWPGGRPIFLSEYQREGPEYHYDEIRLVRLAPVAHEDDLIGPIKRLVRAIRREGARFQLYGHSPAHRLYTIRAGWLWSNVWKFVTTSAIQWNFGREPRDPTHQVMFFSWPTDTVFFKVKFVVAGVEATCPGVVVTLRLRTDKVIHPRGDRAARLDRLFARMVSILRPDHGCVRLSGQPEDEVGWLTYLPLATAPATVPPPAVRVPFADGVKILAAPGPVPDEYGGGAVAIAAVRAAVAGVGGGPGAARDPAGEGPASQVGFTAIE
jgi:hypothetical protein